MTGQARRRSVNHPHSGGHSRDGFMSYEYVRAYMNDAIWIDFQSDVEPGPRSRPAADLFKPHEPTHPPAGAAVFQ
jgi:hypothetical protein